MASADDLCAICGVRASEAFQTMQIEDATDRGRISRCLKVLHREPNWAWVKEHQDWLDHRDQHPPIAAPGLGDQAWEWVRQADPHGDRVEQVAAALTKWCSGEPQV